MEAGSPCPLSSSQPNKTPWLKKDCDTGPDKVFSFPFSVSQFSSVLFKVQSQSSYFYCATTSFFWSLLNHGSWNGIGIGKSLRRPVCHKRCPRSRHGNFSAYELDFQFPYCIPFVKSQTKNGGLEKLFFLCSSSLSQSRVVNTGPFETKKGGGVLEIWS